jgi:hypothetical protein
MQSRFPDRIFLGAHLIILVGLGLSIAGGIKAIPSNPAAEISSGVTLRKAASIMLLLGFLILTAATVRAFTMIRQAWSGDRLIIYAAALSLPFLFIRAMYYVVLTFDTKSAVFNAFKPNIFVQAFMQVLMEFVVFGLYLAAGLKSPSSKDAPHAPKKGEFPKAYSHLGNGDIGEAELASMPTSRAA